VQNQADAARSRNHKTFSWIDRPAYFAPGDAILSTGHLGPTSPCSSRFEQHPGASVVDDDSAEAGQDVGAEQAVCC
jgi:hypothetical protein